MTEDTNITPETTAGATSPQRERRGRAGTITWAVVLLLVLVAAVLAIRYVASGFGSPASSPTAPPSKSSTNYLPPGGAKAPGAVKTPTASKPAAK